MGKGIILRVKDGTVLSPEILKALDKLLPDYRLEYYSEKPNYRQSMMRRMDSLHQAFLFTLEAYPPNPKCTYLTTKTLKNYAEQCRKTYLMNKSSVDDLHQELEKFTANLVEALSLCHDWKGKAIKEATATLNEAEQYMLMNQGRFDLATLIPMNLGEGKEKGYVLQWDESLAPYYPQLLKEIQELQLQHYPKSDRLFRSDNKIQDYQKAYFLKRETHIKTYQDVATDLESFIKQWDKIKSDAYLERIKNNMRPLPDWYEELNGPLKAMVKVLSADSVYAIDEKLKKFSDKINEAACTKQISQNIPEIANIPEWYWVLSDRQQHFLEHVLKNTPTIEQALSFISSRHRTLPLPANFAKHRLYHINSLGQIELLGTERYRSSHIASRDILDCPEEVQLRHASSNFAKVTEKAQPGQPGILQTLISPIPMVEFANQFIEIPDSELHKKGREAVSQSSRAKETIYTNHPYNIAKRFIWTATDNPDCLALIKTAQNYSKNNPDLEELLIDYKNVLNSPTFSATFWDYEGREMFLSSLEQLIIMAIKGFSYGSCVSGKDRKAIELIHTDAMMLYKIKYKQYPKFVAPTENIERIDFVKIVVDLFTSRHQHEHAGQNAPGSEGIKTPSNYFPKDIADAINLRLGTLRGLEYDDRLATDNEVKYIQKNLKPYLVGKNTLLSQLMAKQLGEEHCTRLYDALFNLIEEKQLFTMVYTGFFGGQKTKISEGIECIATMMQDTKAGDSIARVAKSFCFILDRPGPESDEYQGRTEATKLVYNCSRNLLIPPKSKASLEDYLESTIKEWVTLFNRTKKSKEDSELKTITSASLI